jgi:hypothetical protein
MEYEIWLAKLAKKGYKPGDKINRVHYCAKFVASIGEGKDWAVYVAPFSWTWEMCAERGHKISKEDAKRIFPEIAALRLYYRP